MRALLVAAALAVVFVVSLVGQSLSSLDFSQARISVAGPTSFYIRDVGFENRRVSIVVSQGADGNWRIARMVDERDNIVPAGVILDFASVRPVDDTMVEINGILLNGRVYRGRVALTDPGAVGFLGEQEVERVPEETKRRAAEAFDLVIREETAKFEVERAELKSEIAGLRRENDRLAAEVVDQKARIAELEAGFAADIDKRAWLERRNAELELEASALRLRVAEIESAVAEARSAPPPLPRPADGPAPSAGDLGARVAALESDVLRLSAVLEELGRGGWFGIRKAALTRVVLDGFAGSRPHLGRWRIDGALAEQTDGAQFFAKLAIPFVQSNVETLYSFSARATGRGWVGFGLHIFVDGVVKPRGYGAGSSLLVWVTRDRRTYRNDATYLQLYRSVDDINMARVMDAKVEENLADYIKVEVLYDPADEHITIALDGVEKVRYKTFFSIDRGVQVALRTLGAGVSFKNFRAAVKP